ncbi:MAG: MFS transporter [Bifidobacteriaceae bacterium]|jgi:MFS family permease|nr:MFS transporter [Bifidobacteriaceae bacterium]
MNPFENAPASKKLLTLAGIYVAMVAAMCQSSGVSTLLPAAAADVGQAELYPLASTLGGAVSVIVMPLYGWLAARNPAGKRMIMVASLVIGAAVCAARAMAPNMVTIIIVSLFWAFTSAGVFVIAFTMVREMYSSEKAGVRLGVVSALMSAGMIGGPLLTGLLIDLFDWRIASHILWPFLLIAAVLVFVGVRVSAADAAHMASNRAAFDVPGCIGFALFLGGLILVLSLGGTTFAPFGSALNLALIGLTVVGVVIFAVALKQKGDGSFLPVSVLKNRNVLVLASNNAILTASAMALFFFLPSYVINVMQGTATEAALPTTLFGVLGLVLGPFFGKWVARARNARGLVTLGTLVRIAVTLAFLLVLKPTTPIWLVFVLMLIAGVYNSQNLVTNSTAPQIQVAANQRVQGNSVVQLGQNLGSGVGMAVYTMAIAMNGFAGGFRVSLIVALSLAVVALVLAQLLRPLPDEDAATAPAASGSAS